jgi:ubiquinone/menaquinone biosynthesis C-methylase UbiE
MDAQDAWASQAQNDLMWTFTEPHVRVAMDGIRVPNGAFVLDVAAGTGSCAVPLAVRCAQQGSTPHILATDLSPGMVAALAANAEQAGVSSLVESKVMNAAKLELPDHSCDLVLIMFGLMLMPQKLVVAAELARVLKPGGRLIMTAWKSAGSVAVLRSIVAGAGKDPETVKDLEALVYSLATAQQIQDLLRPAGFENIHVSEHEENYDLTGPMLDKYIETFLENPCISGAFVGMPRDDIVAGVRRALAEPSNGGSHFISTITHATKRGTTVTELVGSEGTLSDGVTG